MADIAYNRQLICVLRWMVDALCIISKLDYTVSLSQFVLNFLLLSFPTMNAVPHTGVKFSHILFQLS